LKVEIGNSWVWF